MSDGAQRPMRIMFMGTPEFALPSLNILIENNYTVVGVVTVPDKPAGRGRQLSVSPVKSFAIQHGLDVVQPGTLKDRTFIDWCRDLHPDIMVVVAFRILPPEVYTSARLGAFNLHASLLPKYRGAAPINWAIIRGERESGVTTFFLREKVDTGSVILQARTPISEEMTAGELHDTLAEVGAEIVLHTVRLIESGKASPKPQDDALASDAPKIFKDDCRINWNTPVRDVHNFIRGLSPRPGAFTFHDGKMLKIYRSRISSTEPTEAPGKVLAGHDRLVVAVRDGAIELLELQQEGRKRIPSAEFLLGYAVSQGEELY